MDNLKKIDIQKASFKKKPGLKKWVVSVGVLAVIFFGFFAWLRSSSTDNFNFTFPKVLQSPIKSTDGRVNILLLGNAGGMHDGASLTDSILVASYNLKSSKVTLISIPRDLWVDSAKAKVNTIYQTGEKDGEGLKFAKEKIGEIVGIPVHYGVRLDFNGFARAVDQVDGISVEVPRTFDDYNYPIEGKEKDLCGNTEKEVDVGEELAKTLNTKAGKQKLIMTPTDKPATESADFACRFEHIRFERGRMYMDGVTALKFVRSRMGTNSEGSDFARSRRQQLVLQAFRDKALSLETLVNPAKIAGLVTTFGDSFETDIPLDKSLDFYNLVKKNTSSESIVLGDLGRGQSVLIQPPPSLYGGAYVLVPPNDDFSVVQSFIKLVLETSFDEATKSAALKQ